MKIVERCVPQLLSNFNRSSSILSRFLSPLRSDIPMNAFREIIKFHYNFTENRGEMGLTIAEQLCKKFLRFL